MGNGFIIPPHDFKQLSHWLLPGVVSYKVSVWSDNLWHKLHTKFHENPHRYYVIIKCTQTDNTGGCSVKLVMRMCSGSLVMASSSTHLIKYFAESVA
jgi:hypothetical protein